jgi:hypothetical protein
MLVSRYAARSKSCLTIFVPRRDDSIQHEQYFHPKPLIPYRRGRLIRTGSSTPERPPAVVTHSAITSSLSNLAGDRSGARLPLLEPEMSELPDFDHPDFEICFRVKLSQCHQPFDFVNADATGHHQKARDLLHILKAIEVPGDARRLSPELVRALLEMVVANLDRSLKSIDPRMVITDDIPPFADPEWEHLKLVYRIVVRFQEMVPRFR